MGIALNIVAGLFFLWGAVWFLQGISVLSGVAVAAGIGLFLLANRTTQQLTPEQIREFCGQSTKHLMR
jgi:small neutral amino acid transporter SnatA (MarC family)